MTSEDVPSDGDQVLTLQQLILARKEERGWSYDELARRTGGRIAKARFGQLGVGKRMSEFPEPATLEAIADALEVDLTVVVLAVAKSLGLDVRPRGSAFAQQLPTGVDDLPVAMRDAALATLRAAVAMNADAEDDDGRYPPPAAVPRTYCWPDPDAASGGGSAATRGPSTVRRPRQSVHPLARHQHET